MSSGSQRISGSLDFEESNPEVAPAGVSRLARAGGLMRVSADGLAAGAILPVPTQRIADADLTAAFGDAKTLYFLPAGVLTANRTVTVAATGSPPSGWSITIAVLGVQGFDLLIRDDAATLIHTITAGRKAAVVTFFSAGHAIVNGMYFLP